MCDPVLGVAAVAALASTALSKQAQNKVIKARNSAAEAEAARQDGLQTQAIASFDDTAGKFTRDAQDARLADVRISREEGLQNNIQDILPASAIPTSASAPKVVGGEIAKRLTDSIGEGREFAKRLARIGTFGETTFENNQNLSRGAENVNRLANFSGNSARILPFEFQAANQQGAGLRQAADIFGAIGSVAGAGAASGIGKGAFSTPNAAIRTDAAGRILGPV